MRHASIKSRPRKPRLRGRTTLCVLAASGLGAAVVAGCGNDVPPNAVAKVGDSVITQDEFDKWLNTASASQTSPQGGQAAAPDPPDFNKCVAARQKQPVPKGQKQPSESQLRQQCEQQFEQLKTEVMQFLIQSEWVQQEADAQGIKVTEKEIRRTLEDQKKQAFPNEKAYQRFLEQSGMSEADILFRVRIDQLQQKLTQKITEDAKKVTDQDVQAYYDKNKKRFAQPERRDLLVVLTKSKAKAEQAKRALDNGQSWKQVVNQYSIDEASKAQGGKLPAVAKGQNEKALDDAIFAARKGQLEGPIKTQFGWQVFEVTKITAASQQTLQDSEETIRNLLRSQGQQKALDDFIKDFREDYKNDTNCADDYRVAECKNAPKESTETGPASGGAPNGQGQQPQPQTPSQQSPQP